jgi:hypothetical protein
VVLSVAFPEKSLTFFEGHFFCERDEQPILKFDMYSEVLFIYRLIPRKPDFLGWLTAFNTAPIGRFLGASRSVHGHIQHKNACFWVSVDRYALHRVARKIRWWVVHLSPEKSKSF